MTAMKRSLALLTVLLAVGAAMTPASAKNVNVKVKDNFYDKHFRVILEGDTITWRNDGDNEHTVTPYDSGSFPGSSDSRNCVPNPIIGNDPDDCMDPGDTHTVRFTKPGVYEYYCRAHGNPGVRPDPDRGKDEQPCGMCGIVRVKADQQTSPTVTPTESETRRASPTPSPTETGSVSPSPSPTDGTDGDGGSGEGTVAAGGSGGGDGGGLSRGAIALLAILALSGAGWWTWKRYLAPPAGA